MAPVYFDRSTPPNVNSPLLTDWTFVGSNERATMAEEMTFSAKRLSVTVGIVSLLFGDKVLNVKFVGPRLYYRYLTLWKRNCDKCLP